MHKQQTVWRWIRSTLAAGALSMVSLAASANIPLPVGSSYTFDYFSSDIDNYSYVTSSSATLLTSGGTSFSTVIGGNTFDGILDWRVFSGDSNNMNGGLTFEYFMFTGNTATLPGTIDRFTVDGWSSDVSTDVANNCGGKTVCPFSVDRSSSGSIGWNWVATEFTDSYRVDGGSSGHLFLLTDATAYGSGFATITGGTSSIATVVAAPVPEPETYAMLLVGLGLMGFVQRRRKHNLPTAFT